MSTNPLEGVPCSGRSLIEFIPKFGMGTRGPLRLYFADRAKTSRNAFLFVWGWFRLDVVCWLAFVRASSRAHGRCCAEVILFRQGWM